MNRSQKFLITHFVAGLVLLLLWSGTDTSSNLIVIGAMVLDIVGIWLESKNRPESHD